MSTARALLSITLSDHLAIGSQLPDSPIRLSPFGSKLYFKQPHPPDVKPNPHDPEHIDPCSSFQPLIPALDTPRSSSCLPSVLNRAGCLAHRCRLLLPPGVPGQLGFSTSRRRAWISGGPPTQGLIDGAATSSPFEGVFTRFANPVGDWRFTAAVLGSRRHPHPGRRPQDERHRRRGTHGVHVTGSVACLTWSTTPGCADFTDVPGLQHRIRHRT